MSDAGLTYLLMLAAFTGTVHTVVGPDHYLPLIVMARAGRWSLAKTLRLTMFCGVGHVLGSVLLGTIGIAAGLALGGVESLEAVRGRLAAWLLMGFGLAYAAWGVRQAIRNRPHQHLHVHADGTVHSHTHTHFQDHAHAHGADAGSPGVRAWTLFAVFILGPCEPLIPQLMYPAARSHWVDLMLVVLVFALATVGTMTLAVAAGYWGLQSGRMAFLERYVHIISGLAIAACGLVVNLGG